MQIAPIPSVAIRVRVGADMKGTASSAMVCRRIVLKALSVRRVYHIVAYHQVGVYHIVAYHQVGVYHIVTYHDRNFIKKLASGKCRVNKLY